MQGPRFKAFLDVTDMLFSPFKLVQDVNGWMVPTAHFDWGAEEGR
jgi:hypothetical protein